MRKEELHYFCKWIYLGFKNLDATLFLLQSHFFFLGWRKIKKIVRPKEKGQSQRIGPRVGTRWNQNLTIRRLTMSPPTRLKAVLPTARPHTVDKGKVNRVGSWQVMMEEQEQHPKSLRIRLLTKEVLQWRPSLEGTYACCLQIPH